MSTLYPNKMNLQNLDLEARTEARMKVIQFLRFEAAYPDLSDIDRLALNVAFNVLMRLNKRDNPGRKADAGLLPINSEVVALIERLANYLGETHALDKSNEHYGDDLDETPCSYCDAIQEANEFLRPFGGETL